MKKNCSQSGFTLLEIMLAMICSAFVVMGIAFVLVAPFREAWSAPVKAGVAARADEAVRITRDEIRNSSMADLYLFTGNSGILNTNGSFAIYSSSTNLIYTQDGVSTTLLDSEVSSFTVTVNSSGLYAIQLDLDADNGSAVYATQVRCR
jgi:type II secretory pathway pseudopilin PulG